jgi:diguanylate cyclase (GGDEF)-like protein
VGELESLETPPLLIDPVGLLKRIASTRGLDALLALLGDEIEKLHAADGYTINLRDAVGNNLRSLKLRFPERFRYLEKTYYGFETPLSSTTNTNIKAFTSLGIARLGSDSPEHEKQLLARWEANEFAAVAIAKADSPDYPALGTILLIKQDGRIADSGLEHLKMLGEFFYLPLSIAVENYWLKEFKDRFAATADEHARALKFIIEINNITSTDRIFELFAAELFRQIAFDCIGVFMLDNGILKNRAVMVSRDDYLPVRDEWSAYLQSNHYGLENIDGGVSHVFMNNSSLMFTDVQKILHLPMSQKDQDCLRMMKTPRTLLVLPIRYQEKPIGCIAFFSLAGVIELSKPDLQLLDVLSSFLGTAITNGTYFALSQAQNVELERLATHDILTGLPNRALLHDRLQLGLERWKRTSRKATIAFIDLDHFKSINDTFGHSAGDLVVAKIAQRLKSCLRGCDTIARMGGDEFILILEDIDGEEAHEDVLQRALDAVSEPIQDFGPELSLTCSIGFSRYPGDGSDADALLDAADAAMYLAKQLGRSNIQRYAPGIRLDATERLGIESLLRHAIERNELELHYQPKADLQTGCIVGVEALVRWHHPEKGITLPNAFIPVAEESGLIVPIGEWILRTACEQSLAWQKIGIHTPVAVNLSARQFQQPSISSQVRDILVSTGLKPRYLELELTETMSMHNPEKSIAVMRTFKAMGITLTIDDFGTGYSNLSYLQRFPVDKLKLDRSFVQEIAGNLEALAISQAVLAVAHSLRLKVVAEGIETADQLDILTAHRCDEMQGFYFSKPMASAECTRFLRKDPKLFTQ